MALCTVPNCVPYHTVSQGTFVSDPRVLLEVYSRVLDTKESRRVEVHLSPIRPNSRSPGW